MATTLNLAYSPCPNDTYIFHALVHGLVECAVCRFAVTLDDVESLNQAARAGRFEVTKLSYAALGHLLDRYVLLRSGSALGRGCGPLLVAAPGRTLAGLGDATIAVPGRWTTAALLLGLYQGRPPDMAAMPFETIMPAVSRGDYAYGVIIHEGRFTFSRFGLDCLLDLGRWWEENTGLPIPLGGIAIRRDQPAELAAEVEAAIRRSIEFARAHPDRSADYIHRHAQEMAPDVIRGHIELYVNEFSLDIGPEGEAAIRRLYTAAALAGLLPRVTQSLFLD
ncbi:MAG: 1,4-dihydroxy-6-naphthoate synthase [Acidobacteria bacterium]|nr:1,4-dihydroxy-6-naphthoate synthase [Acidobacteriota bacterium]